MRDAGASSVSDRGAMSIFYKKPKKGYVVNKRGDVLEVVPIKHKLMGRVPLFVIKRVIRKGDCPGFIPKVPNGYVI